MSLDKERSMPTVSSVLLYIIKLNFNIELSSLRVVSW